MAMYAGWKHFGKRVRTASGVEGEAYSQRGSRLLVKDDAGLLHWADWSKCVLVEPPDATGEKAE